MHGSTAFISDVLVHERGRVDVAADSRNAGTVLRRAAAGVRVVKHVESFRPEFELLRFPAGKPDDSRERQRIILTSGVVERVPPQIPIRADVRSVAGDDIPELFGSSRRIGIPVGQSAVGIDLTNA